MQRVMQLASHTILLVLAMTLFILPAMAFGQAAPQPPSKLVPCDGLNCNFCHLVQLGQNILNFSIYLAMIIAAIMFAYAGYLYISSRERGAVPEKAKNMFTSVFWGIVIILGAWLVVDIILDGLLEVDLGSLNVSCRVR